MGPLVAALFMAFWGLFIREFGNESTENVPNRATGSAEDD
jgi:hypothetical protein